MKKQIKPKTLLQGNEKMAPDLSSLKGKMPSFFTLIELLSAPAPIRVNMTLQNDER